MDCVGVPGPVLTPSPPEPPYPKPHPGGGGQPVPPITSCVYTIVAVNTGS